MSRNLSGEATLQEREELMAQLQHRPVLMQQYEMMRRMWEGYTGLKEAGATQSGPEEAARISRILQLSAAEDSLRDKDSAPAWVIAGWNWKKIANRAAIAAGLVLGIWGLAHWYEGRHLPVPANEIVAKRGSKTRTILPDGSTVWLNAGSSIQYEPGFNGPQREVTLRGEAFFDVVKNAQPALYRARGRSAHQGIGDGVQR